MKNILNYIQSSATTLPSQKKYLFFREPCFQKCCAALSIVVVVSVGAAILYPWGPPLQPSWFLESAVTGRPQFARHYLAVHQGRRFSTNCIMSLGSKVNVLSKPVDISAGGMEDINGKLSFMYLCV